MSSTFDGSSGDKILPREQAHLEYLVRCHKVQFLLTISIPSYSKQCPHIIYVIHILYFVE